MRRLTHDYPPPLHLSPGVVLGVAVGALALVVLVCGVVVP